MRYPGRVASIPSAKPRCEWCGFDPLYVRYHDEEWGVVATGSCLTRHLHIPVHRRVHNVRKHFADGIEARAARQGWCACGFEFLILEGAQAGLSWITILRKRENYRAAFAGFDARKVARFDARKLKPLLGNAGIVRNRLKIESAVSNARAFLAVQKEFGSFDRYVWRFVGGRPIVNRREHMKQLPARTAESDALSADLKKRGFRFVGSTIIHAHMQAVGMVNDHTVGCFRHRPLAKPQTGHPWPAALASVRSAKRT